MNIQFSNRCEARHFGPWLIELSWLESAVSAVRSGVIVEAAATPKRSAEPEALYQVTDGGVAYIPIQGHMQKGWSKYGGVSTLEVRRALRMAMADETVKGALLHIDSPGGSVAGTADLAEDVKMFGRKKPIHAHIDDLGASAAYWIASQTKRISVNPTGEVGSIGTVAVVWDESGKMDQRGVQVHVISTGQYKGAMAPGAPVLPEHLAYLRERVADLNTHFLSAVAKGRGVPLDRVDNWADGRVWIGQKAKRMGLVDSVETMDAAFNSMHERVASRRKVRSRELHERISLENSRLIR